MLVLLHTDRVIGAGPPSLLNAIWNPFHRSSEQHVMATEQKMRQVGGHPSGGTVWAAELPVPAAFSTPGLLSAQEDSDAAVDAAYIDAHDVAGLEDDDEAIEAVERLKQTGAAAPWSEFGQSPDECLLSRGIVIRKAGHSGMVNLRISGHNLHVPEADPEQVVRTVHLQNFRGGSLPPYAGVRLVDQRQSVTVQNLPAPFALLSGTLSFSISLPGQPNQPAEVKPVLLWRVTPADVLGGTLIASWPRSPPNQAFPALVASHWRRIYLELLAALPRLGQLQGSYSTPAVRLHIHSHVLAFAARQSLGPPGGIRNTDAAMRSLVAVATTASISKFTPPGAKVNVGPNVDATEQFLSGAFAAAATCLEEVGDTGSGNRGSGTAGSSTAHATAPFVAGKHYCDSLWLLGFAGQIAHALRHPVHPNGERLYDEGQTRGEETQGEDGRGGVSGARVEIRPPASMWALLTPHLWGGDGLGALTTAADQMASSFGRRAVRAGLGELLSSDAQWLLSHRECDVLPRGVSSYRFSRLPPLRRALGDSGDAARQYAMHINHEAAPRWLRELRGVRKTVLPWAAVLGDRDAAEVEEAGMGRAQAARQCLKRAEVLTKLARSITAILCPNAGLEVLHLESRVVLSWSPSTA